ncbi:MAG: SpaA isopeptide-forming pilin-related protein, partial [Oscillospiraceae bacterium]
VLETEAPAGYVKAPNPITLTLLAGETKEAKFVNTCAVPSTIKILKVDPNNQPLAGGKFSIYSGSTTTGTPLYTNLTTNASGIVTQGGLAAGTYTVLETEAPAGYVKAPNPITLTLLAGETKEAKFVNTCTKGIINLFLYDSVSRQQIAGGEFTVYDSPALTHAVAHLTSLASGPAIDNSLAPGTYYIKETKAPSGYLPDPNPQTIVIEACKTSVVNFYNTRSIPTSGNYGRLLIIGIFALSMCAAGWLWLFLYKKRSVDKNYEENL